MADCSYSRCIQQKRFIRRELQRWTKNMVYIVGLERIAEELMGRRKWKLYQESMSRNYLQPINNNVEKISRTNENYNTKKEQQHQRNFSSNDSNDQKLLILQDEETSRTTTQDTKDATVKEDDIIATTTTTTSVTATSPTIRRDEDDLKQQLDAEERLKDWQPQSKCYFCVDGKLDSETNTSHGALSPQQSDSDSSESHSDSEAPPTLTPPTGLLNNNHNMTTIESVTSMAALASAVAALSGNPTGAPTPLLSFYPPGLLQPNWYPANVARNCFQTERMDVEKSSATGEQPLDLSSKGTTNNNNSSNNNMTVGSPVENKMPSNMRLPTLDSKQIFKAKPRMSAIAGRRTYTEDELQAALRDIQSGKLGTRRAAVIYGIPRSTLRNKVYKLAMERERESHLNSTTPLKIDEEEPIDDDKELSGAEEEKEVEKALQGPLLSMADIVRFSNLENQEALKTLLQRGKEGSTTEQWTGLEHGSYMQNLISNQKPPTITEREINPLALLPEFLKRMISEEQLKGQHHNGENEKTMRMGSPSMKTDKGGKTSELSDMETDESPSNVILKIPSFKPTTSKNGNDYYRSPTDTSTSVGIVSPPVNTASESGSPPILPGRGMTLKDVKDVIAKSINQKFQQVPEPLRMPPIMEMDYKRTGFTPPIGGMPGSMKNQDLNRSYPPPHQKPPQSSSSTSTSSSSGGKGTRPKRGKYRNYDRDSLVEAVRAVQRGEMSVHRAGSYYGVPHSTLEYKVKERHLMRPRKRDPKPNPVDEKIASLKQNDLRVAAAAAVDKMKPAMKPPQPKFPPTSPNGMKLPIFDPSMAPLGYNPPPFPFWPHPGFSHLPPLDYGRNPSTSSFPPNPEQFFASQMMQKLQEESARGHPNAATTAPSPAPPLPKSARQIAESLLDGTGSNGSFLDGIIRSSLESGVPGSEDKTAKDEKNLAPENMSNKALLDQLCRNSRLTPLPKPEMNNGENRTSPINFSTTIKEESRMAAGSPNDKPETIELSNDSNESIDRNSTSNGGRDDEPPTPPITGKIYLKPDLVKPENLKPEMLIRFRDVLMQQDVDRNGIGEPPTTGSASESDAAQD